MIVEFFDGNRLPNNTLRKFQEETGRRFIPHSIRPIKGWIDLPTVPGMGFDPDTEAIEEYKKTYKFREEGLTVGLTMPPVNNNLFLSV